LVSESGPGHGCHNLGFGQHLFALQGGQCDLHFFDFPVGTPLGKNENCFGHVQVTALDVEHGLDGLEITPKAQSYFSQLES